MAPGGFQGPPNEGLQATAGEHVGELQLKLALRVVTTLQKLADQAYAHLKQTHVTRRISGLVEEHSGVEFTLCVRSSEEVP